MYINVCIYNCVIDCTVILHMCIYIPMNKYKFMSIYMHNRILYVLCNIIILCTACSDIYKHMYTLSHVTAKDLCQYMCIYLYMLLI